MNIFIFIAGLAIGVSAFLYVLSAVSGGMKKIQNPSGETDKKKSEKTVKQNIEPDSIGFRGRFKVPPGSRICPLCGSELTKYEGLYATRIKDNSEYKILIMGCKYCFKEK